ncbi:Nucleoside triphosphate pyrophosphohydrolase [Halioglobus japonicus]|nr:Nucleoside triphosphate pyrophosphohydrolase [Halioglobus japonicus]
MTTVRYSTADLLRVMERLRDPQTGCPWDLEQDFKSIVSSTLEECYELVHAIEEDDYEHVAEELGDVLFQVVFYAQLGKEQNLFSFDSVVNILVEKLIRRHPHVFADGELEGIPVGSRSIDEVGQTWELIKQRERDARNQSGVLADIPLALPALSRAQKVQKRAAQVNFDWADTASVVDKLQEELDELRSAIAIGQVDAVRDEIGDVLFTCVNLARHLDMDAEKSLRDATAKFERRFWEMESTAASQGIDLSTASEARYDQLWRQVKARLDTK